MSLIINHLNKEMLLQLEEVKAQVVSIFSILDADNNYPEKLELVLFLLSAYNHDILSNRIFNENNKLGNRIALNINNSNKNIQNIFEELANFYEPSIQKLSIPTLNAVYNQIFSINKSHLRDVYPILFEDSLNRIFNLNKTYAGDIYQPKDLSIFLSKISGTTDNSKVFNPFGGLASFAIHLNQYKEYYGQELNKNLWALATLRLIANNKINKAKFDLYDSVLHWPNENDKFDLVISIPPLGIQINEKYKGQKKFHTIQQYLIENGVNSLNENGKLITIVPEGALSGQLLSKNILPSIVNSDYLETLIYLPSRFFEFTSARMVILVISKHKKNKGEIQIIDTNSLCNTNNKNKLNINFDFLYKIIESKLEIPFISKLTSYNEVIRNSYNFQHSFKTKSKPLFEIMAKLGEVFNILRSEDITPESYDLVLLLLSLYKEKILKPNALVKDQNIKKEINYAIQNSERNLYNEYWTIYKIFEPTLASLSNKGLLAIVNVICNVDHKILSQNFSELFDSILFNLEQSKYKFGSEFIQPLEFTRLISGLFDLPTYAKVYNPFAGLASFGLKLDKDIDYFGQELNQKTWALGTLRIKAYERQVNKIKYVCDDSILNWPNDSQKFDLIVSSLPTNLRLGKKYEAFEYKFKRPEQLLIERGLDSLTNEGKLITILPQRFLHIWSHKSRKILIDQDFIETIISIPGGLLAYTGIPLIILVINKKKSTPGKVNFIKADKFVETVSKHEKILNDYALINLIKYSKEDIDSLRVVDINHIKACNYNLNITSYFQKEIELSKNDQLFKLKDVLECIKGQKDFKHKSGKLLKIGNLRNDDVDFRLNVSTIEDADLQRSDIVEIAETCMLLATKGRTLKPTFFVFEGEPIYKAGNIEAFKANESIADYGYLINELQSEYIHDQLELYQSANTIPSIRRDDLLEVAIKLPPLLEQKSKLKSIFELSDKIRTLQDERNALAHDVNNKLYESVSTIKHSLGKPLLNIGSSLRNIENALSRTNSEWKHVKLNERYDLTIKDSFNSIYDNLDLIHSMLRKNESILDVSNYKLVQVYFLNFIKGYVNRVKSAEKSNVITKLDIHPDFKSLLKNEVLIWGNTELLEIGLNAIVENANMHAFIDDSKKYKLNFRVSLFNNQSKNKHPDETIGKFDTYIKVEVSNNGKPFPKNYTLEKLTRKNSFAGPTGNTGQGGFDLNEIIKYHNNGTSTLYLTSDDFTTEFTTTYSFLIPFNR
jgi:type I restriction enzyme M protein